MQLKHSETSDTKQQILKAINFPFYLKRAVSQRQPFSVWYYAGIIKPYCLVLATRWAMFCHRCDKALKSLLRDWGSVGMRSYRS